MSTEGDKINKITANKPKNPGRQEQGRKLGKMMKERKLKNQQEMEKEQKVQKFSLGSLVRLDYCLVASVIIIVVTIDIKVLTFVSQQQKLKTRNHSFLPFDDFV